MRRSSDATTHHPTRQTVHDFMTRHQAALPLVMAVTAVLVDGAFLTRPGLWRDEAATGWVVQHPMGQIVDLCRWKFDAVLFVYYTIIHAVVRALGFSTFVLRLPSVLAVGLGAAALTATGRRLGGGALGVACGAAYLLLPRSLWAAVEARPYAMASAAVAWALWALVRVLGSERAGVRDWVLWSGLGVLAIHLHLHSAIVIMLLAIAGLVLARGARARVGLLVSGLVTVLACVPLLLKARTQAAQVSWIAVNRPFDSLAEQIIVDSYTPYRTAPQYLTGLQAGVRWVAWILVGTILLTLVGCLVRRTLPATISWLGLFPVVGFPVVLLAAGKLAGQFLLTDRYFTVACAPMALLLGAVACHFPWRRTGLLLLTGALCATVILAAQQRTTLAKSWLDDHVVIARALEEHAHPGDAFVFEDTSYWEPAASDSVDSGRHALGSYPEAFTGLVDVARPEPEVLENPWPLDVPADPAEAMDHDRLWVISVRPDTNPGLSEQLPAAGWCRQEQYEGPMHTTALWTHC